VHRRHTRAHACTGSSGLCPAPKHPVLIALLGRQGLRAVGISLCCVSWRCVLACAVPARVTGSHRDKHSITRTCTRACMQTWDGTTLGGETSSSRSRRPSLTRWLLRSRLFSQTIMYTGTMATTDLRIPHRAARAGQPVFRARTTSADTDTIARGAAARQHKVNMWAMPNATVTHIF
jgi:hypothetical protein